MERKERTPGVVAWTVLAASLVAGVVALAVPPLRSPVIAVAAWASVALVLAGVGWHRPHRALAWLAVALMLGLWAVGTTLVQVDGRSGPTVGWVTGAGQLVAVVVTIVLVRSTSAREGRREGTAVDGWVIAVVLGLVAAQLVAEAAGAGLTVPRTSSLLVPTVDIAVIGLLLRLFVTHARLQPAVLAGLAAAVTTVAYDLLARLAGHRLALPGTPLQALGVVCVLLFGVAALHPTMGEVFDPRAVVVRPASRSLLGLLPLVVVPLALWAVARASHTVGLPTPVFLVAGSVVAGLCLVRGASALRDTEHLADHDPLTGLLNRRGLARAFEAGPPPGGWSMVLVDVDEFKAVNDTHGHDVGDALLLRVRDRLVRAVAGAGSIARFGGDEFVVLVQNGLAGAVTSGVLGVLRDPVELDGLVLATTGSVGVALAEPGLSLSELVTRADIAMYAAKTDGRDTSAVYRADMRVEVTRRYTLKGQLRQLLGGTSPDVGRLEVHYQPLVELVSGRVVGAEALVRWSHPDNGLMPPASFLELVNSGGLDTQLDTLVLEQIVGDLRCWLSGARRPVPISLNLTRASMQDDTLAGRVLTTLARAGVAPSLLHVEITEHEQLPDDLTPALGLARLRAAGIEVHLDDYGTGYTSLDYLRRFPIDVLKLDRSVVLGVTDGRDHLVAGITAMAATLSLDVLAEGVETVEQRSALVALGVRFGQGWLFAEPLTASQFGQQVLDSDRVLGRAAPVAVTRG